jgi:Flp pilus assembly protein TadD
MVVLRLVFRLLAGMQLWWRARNFRRLLGGLPALLAGGAALALVTLGLLTPAQELEARYLEQAKSSFKAKDYAAALTCYERLACGGEDRPEVLYGLALAAEALGQDDRAAALMNGLAPADRQGYAQAHLWQARHLLSAPEPSAQARAEAEAHVLHALDGELEDRDAAHALLGELYVANGQFDQAQLHFAKAVRTRPRVHMRLAVLYAQRGDRERARGEAQLAISYYQARAKADLQDREARVRWADAKAFLEDFPGAAGVLEEGWAATHDDVYRVALARVYLAWADFLGRDGKADPGDRLRLLERGLAYNPADQGLLDRLLAATRVQGPEADKARADLQGLLARGEAPAMVHFALGLDAYQHGNLDQARVHWERAQQLDPRAPTIANNLACALLEGKNPDLPRALDLANLALQRSPNDPNFRDTRGRILARMGKWQESLADLEAALPGSPDNPRLHQALAEVYDHLGVRDMAARHQRLAEEHQPEKKAAPHGS